MNNEAKIEDYRSAAKIHRGLGIFYVILVLLFAYLSIESGMWGASVLVGAIGVLHFLAYYGLNNNRGWGSALSGLLAVMLLLGFPIGTILGASILFYMFRVPRKSDSDPLQPVGIGTVD